MKNWVASNRFGANAIVFALYVSLAQCSIFVANSDYFVSPFWPPFGLIVASVIVGRRLLLPGIFLGAFTTQLIFGNPLPSALFISLGITLSAFVAHLIIGVIRQQKSQLGKLTNPTCIIVASLSAPLVSASIGAFSLHTLEYAEPSISYGMTWFTWWMGDSIGALVWLLYF